MTDNTYPVLCYRAGRGNDSIMVTRNCDGMVLVKIWDDDGQSSAILTDRQAVAVGQAIINAAHDPPRAEPGVTLTVRFHRLDASDRVGMVDVEGPGFLWCDAGSHEGIQCCDGVDAKSVSATCRQIADLVRKQWPEPTPLVEKHP